MRVTYLAQKVFDEAEQIPAPVTFAKLKSITSKIIEEHLGQSPTIEQIMVVYNEYHDLCELRNIPSKYPSTGGGRRIIRNPGGL